MLRLGGRGNRVSSLLRPHHLGHATIDGWARTEFEAKRLVRLPFRTGIHDHVAVVDPMRHDITDCGGAMAEVTAAASVSVSVAPVGVLAVERADFLLTTIPLLMDGFHTSHLFGTRRVRVSEQRDHQHDGGDDEEREDRTYLTKLGIPSCVRLVARSLGLSESSCQEVIQGAFSPRFDPQIE